MEKYVVTKPKIGDSTTASSHCDLLTSMMLIQQNASVPQPTKVFSVKNSGKGSLSSILQNEEHKNKVKLDHESVKGPQKILNTKEWDDRNVPTVSMLDLTCQQRLKQIKSRNFTGWKADRDGNKIYTTFRNGQRVEASGKEAFLLAYGDGAIKKKGNDATAKRSIDDVDIHQTEITDDCKPKRKVSEYIAGRN